MVIINKLFKRITIVFLFIIAMGTAIAAQNVLDVKFSENVYEEVTYNPLGPTAGLYVDANENRSLYTMNGTIFITNNHNTEAVQDILLNITGINNVYNVNYSNGSLGYVIDFNTVGDYMIILIPDLPAGGNTTFTYDVNTTNIGPALNFTSNYSDSRIFAGLPISITDNIENTMNDSLYTNNCLYDINITQYALDVNQSGTIYNFTYDGSSMTGSDSGNAVFDALNRTIFWDTWAGGCFYAKNTTDISYTLETPSAVNVANDYKIINTTIMYKYNGTFSRLALDNIDALLDVDLVFDKYMQTVLTGDNATWRVNGSVFNPTNITINLTQVSFWVSVRDSTGTGFTNPGNISQDTVSGANLTYTLNPNVLLNNTLSPWNSSGNEWYFNYTFSSTPIVWMDLDNFIVNDGIQLTNRSISYANNSIYIKEIYIATGYWLQISRNITRLGDNWYNVYIQVVNLGTSPTPANKVVQVYNFLHNAFTLNSSFVTSTSPWYLTQEANETLTDPIYNGTMYQFGLVANGNPSNSSLDSYGGALNINNTWTLTYNVTGNGEFNFDDLFLTGVDPLNVEGYGGTDAITIEGVYGYISSKAEIILGLMAVVVGALALFF